VPYIIAKERLNNQKISIILDPPRKGCDLAVIKAIIDSEVDKIVYVSCMPSTLARDIGLLVGTLKEQNGEIIKVENPILRYDIEFIRPFDMFPQTKHVETLVCLVRKTD
jgi:tRNA/tmRNA/rRNA uracil-C5-methylase (TrmA/RlmC/RlmD family)